VIAIFRCFSERRDSFGRLLLSIRRSFKMLRKSPLILTTVSAMAASYPAFAQNAGAAAGGQVPPGMGGVPPVGTTTNPGSAGISPPPGGSSTTGTATGSTPGLNTGGVNQPGVPNTLTPGTIGTGASPSGLPGDDPAHPGFPGKVGK
jgi:hypothetical protein